MAYTCSDDFMNLYHAYTGDHGPKVDNIATALTNKIKSATVGISGPLIIVNNSHVMAYDTDANERLACCDYRASPTNGFYEMTAISHVGPALMSLSLLHSEGAEVD